MVACGGDAVGEVDEALAAEESGQGLAGVEPTAVQVALAVWEQAVNRL